MNVKTTISRWAKRRRFAQLAVLALVLAALGIPYARAQGMMGGGGMGMMGGRAGAVPHHAPKALSRYGCMSCHAVDSGKVGPAFAWVAWKYRDDRQASSRISAFIEHGGAGTWGGVMPDLNVPPDQARRITRWILSLPPAAPPDGASGGSR